MVMRSFFLLPFITVERFSAGLDRHCSRWWEMKALEAWGRSQVPRVAWAIALAGWASCCAWFFDMAASVMKTRDEPARNAIP